MGGSSRAECRCFIDWFFFRSLPTSPISRRSLPSTPRTVSPRRLNNLLPDVDEHFASTSTTSRSVEEVGSSRPRAEVWGVRNPLSSKVTEFESMVEFSEILGHRGNCGGNWKLVPQKFKFWLNSLRHGLEY